MIKRWFTRRDTARVRVLMVCMGNICRSPMAEAVLRRKLAAAGLAADVVVDSAGTLGQHAGAAPDRRALALAASRGYDMTGIRSRRVRDDDFERHDLVLAMDARNLESLQARCPEALAHRLHLLLANVPGLAEPEVPDPYYGSPAAFEHALGLIEAGCDAWLPELRRQLAALGARTA